MSRNGVNPEASAEQARILSELTKGKSVLEIGAGDGYTTFIYAGSAKRIFAIDPNEKELGKLMQNAKEKNLDGKIAVKKSSLFDLNGGEKYDFALFSFSLHHMPPAKALRKAFEFAENVIVFDHYLNSEWTEMCGEAGKVRREWKAISRHGRAFDEPIDAEYEFDNYETLLKYVAECAAAVKRAKKYKNEIPIKIKSPRMIVALKKK
jgi:SAM-dependent methyltransferase